MTVPAVRIYGPAQDGYASIQDGRIKEDGDFTEIRAANLGDAIAAYKALTGLAFTPYDGPEVADEPRYFTMTGGRDLLEGSAWDIHVLRGEEEICPAHDLTFALVEGDILVIGMLVC